MSMSQTVPGDPSILAASSPKEETFQGFNTFFGVYLPSVLCLFGVILFLRLGYILGNVGLLKMIGIILIATTITFVTALSISATATNMKVKGGGVYYVVSRSFGVEIGSAIGLALFCGQVISIAFAVEGFSESVRFIWPQLNVHKLETIALLSIALLTYISSQIALKTQSLILVVIVAALCSFFLGQGYSVSSNDFTSTMPTLGFWGAFALFFPAVTGMEAGFSMSGDLRDSSKSLPRGTILAVLTGFIGYICIILFLWKTIPIETLKADPMVFFNSARIKVLAIIGLWAATFACAIGGFLGAPRTLQALAKDGIVPSWLGKSFGANNEPRIATIITFFLALGFVYFGNINLLAPILSMFCLISYGMLNLTAGLESLFGNPSWRPSFSVPTFISLTGASLCLLAMLMIDAGATIIAIGIVILFYLITKRKNLGKGWEDIRQGGLLFFCRFAIYRLAALGPSVRCWRPYFLVFSSSPLNKTSVIDFAHSITNEKGLLTVTSIITAQDMDNEKLIRLRQMICNTLYSRKIYSLVELEKADDCYQGMRKIISSYGLGPLTPNTIVFGYNANGGDYCKEAEVVMEAYDIQKNVIVLKNDTSSKQDTIDIWWDDDSKMNSELMLVLAYMLSDTSQWRKCKVNLKCVVDNEHGREHRVNYFKEFFSKSRLDINVQVLVIPEECEVSFYKTLSRFSTEATFVFLGLKPPSPQETLEEYSAYLKKMMGRAKHFKHLAYVLCGEKVELSKIFNYPESLNH